MKKIFLAVILTSVFLLTGCQKYNEKTIKKDITKKVNDIKGYHILGDLVIYNGDNTYKYDVEVSNDKDKYRVSLINKSNTYLAGEILV